MNEIFESKEGEQESRFKKVISAIVKNKYFDLAVLLLILLSSIIFTIDSPLNDPKSNLSTTLTYLDWIITVLFVLEIFLKCISYGIFFNGPKSYMRNWFNIIDVLIVCISVSLIIKFNHILVTFSSDPIFIFFNIQDLENLESIKTNQVDLKKCLP